MPKNKLFSLFDDKQRSPNELTAGTSQNLDSLGNNVVESSDILRKIQQLELVSPKVDYSNFSNFVFFNSALDYFNISGERIINEYPYDGTSESEQEFLNSLDDYQKYLVSIWPKSQGYLQFDPAEFSYIDINDLGFKDGVSRTSMLNAGTGSLSIEFWAISPPALTGTIDAMILAQKITGSGEGYSVFFSGSSAFFRIVSGSTIDEVSASFTPGAQQYFCFTYDRTLDLPIVSAYTGDADDYPVLISSLTGSIIGNVNAGTSHFFIGSGTLATKTTIPLTGSIDDLRLWKVARDISSISSSYNTKIYSQEGLYGLWRFNEPSSGSITTADKALVHDSSGMKFNGTIVNYFPEIRKSGSFLAYDPASVLRSLDSTDVTSFILEQQTSGTLYDRNNDNAVTRLLPEQFFLLEEFKNTTVLQNFLYVIGRYFDSIKIRIDQFSKVLTTNYGQFNQTPDAILEDIGKFFGWEFTGNFLNADVLQYIIGKQVLANNSGNKNLDIKLFEIKNEFWKRSLINLMHLYKTKGTRESVESLMRIYGINKNFVRLKEFGSKPEVGIATVRLQSEKSVAALTFGSGSSQSTNCISSEMFDGVVNTIEARLRFPTSLTSNMTASLLTGSIWSLNTGSDGTMQRQLYFTKESETSHTGSLIYTGSDGYLALTPVAIFDNKWYNIAVIGDAASSSLKIDVRSIEQDEVVYHVTASLFTTPLTTQSVHRLHLGSTGSMASQYWMQEVRVWNGQLSETELNDHALNFQSFGTEESDGLGQLFLHWRLSENVSADSLGQLYNSIYDYSGVGNSGSGVGFMADVNPFKKFLNDYNFIASPEYGWNEEKIRSIDSSIVTSANAFVDNPMLSLEFNLVDALNEDISQIIATMDSFNEYIGSPSNRYRDEYVDLHILRENYFKRLDGSINFRVFADLLEFFDRSFVDMVRRLIPARATFLGDEFVVESHMLERPKLQWNYRRRDLEFQPEGVIKVYVR